MHLQRRYVALEKRVCTAANSSGRNDLASAVVETALKLPANKGAILIDVELPNAGK